MKGNIERFLDYQRIQRRSARTVEIYKRQLGALAKYLEGLAPPCSIEEVDHTILMGFIAELVKAKKISARTQESYITAIRSFFKWASKSAPGGLAENPAAELQYPSRRPAPKGTLTFEQLVSLLDTPGLETEIARRDTAIIAFFCATAARVSALCDLNVEDVRRDRMEVARSCKACGAAMMGDLRMSDVTAVRIREKGDKMLDIPPADEAVWYLSLYLQLRGGLVSGQPLFSSTRGGHRLDRRSIQYRLELHAKRAGITDTVTPHALRRATIGWWHDYGVPGETISKFVGHSNLRTTQLYKDITTRSFALSGIAGGKNMMRILAKRSGIDPSTLFAPG